MGRHTALILFRVLLVRPMLMRRVYASCAPRRWTEGISGDEYALFLRRLRTRCGVLSGPLGVTPRRPDRSGLPAPVVLADAVEEDPSYESDSEGSSTDDEAYDDALGARLRRVGASC